MKIKLVFAMDEQGGFGYKGTMPWPHNAKDLELFKQETMGLPMLMGRKTFESLPGKLPGRHHTVLSSSIDVTAKNGDAPDMIIASNLREALAYSPVDELVIIGGAKLIEEAMDYADELVITVHKGKFKADVFLHIHDFSKFKPLESIDHSDFITYRMEK